DDVYDQFVTAVAVGRSIGVQKVKELSDGRIFTGRQAFEIGLVDKLGSLEEAIKLAAELVGIKGKPKIVSEKKERSLLFKLLENKVLSYMPNQLHIIPGLQYLWQY
ncbi:MAG: S49 family peptidase, partial [Nitrospinota bacterium]|nr:S49 family peptidase [Nitrospinota bacterium]